MGGRRVLVGLGLRVVVELRLLLVVRGIVLLVRRWWRVRRFQLTRGGRHRATPS
ncbi:hypothetical protein ACIQZO_36220 [Streptomyces sp. NPDC097617]|uniref:hypothetical protein n=1 Tax=Streptomyces sp. NPDC097617 TaxID=3366091 RepID=UPI00381398B9